jgi:DNA polymerase
MVAVTTQMRPMSDEEKLDWRVNERINDRGIKIDRELAELAQKYADFEKEDLGERLAILTDGAVTAVTQSAKAVKWVVQNAWVSEQGAPWFECIFKVDKKTKERKMTFDKAARASLLELDCLTPVVREVVEIFEDGSNSSVAKFTAMLNRADPDTDRVHGCLVFAGAGQTKRYSSKGLQLQNFKRDCFNAEQTTTLKELMRSGGDLQTDFNTSSIMETLAKLLRPAIIPEAGHKFVVGDWSAIEARVLPWLSDSKGGEKVLDIFRGGRDIYRETADAMGYDERQTGKVAVLSLGFGGAVGALQAMCKGYGIAMTDAAAQLVVNRWRRANPWAKKFWAALELASVKAVRNPLTVYTAGRIRYIFVPKLLGGTLICILPDDSTIQYPYAKLRDGTVHCMKASVQPKADSNDAWPTMSLWGGILAQGATQAVAACLLREKLRVLDHYNHPVTMHLHDEIVLEVAEESTGVNSHYLRGVMETVPEWAKGLPLEAKPEVFDRYGK